MQFRLKDLTLVESRTELRELPAGKLFINTLNAYSYNVALKDAAFAQALLGGDVLLPDGMAVVWACRWVKAKSRPKERVAGWDLFEWEMRRMDAMGGRALFFGSSEKVLGLIKTRAQKEYPSVEVLTYSPPFKAEFSEDDSAAMIAAINAARPDVLFIGMTAPKQEKWAYRHWGELDIDCHVCTVGAVFNFFAGTEKRAPLWWQQHGLEWLHRLLHNPRRLWKRYLIGNVAFLRNVMKEEAKVKN